MGIYSTSIYSILHEHLAIKKTCSRWIPHNLRITPKNVRVVCKEMLEKYEGGASKYVYKIVTAGESWICAYEPETKQPCGFLNPSQTKRKLFVEKAHIKKKCVVNVFRRQKMLLKFAKTIFWRCLNRSRKANTNDGRTSKHSEQHYAKKCKTSLWKCQIPPGNTRHMLGQKFP